ncbi:hypothetical protein CPC08DRAFT_461947 [Agrocybe pediades]|nr:hypothetical protein CPC08DRAFT_461947 [Agrocybe pediades]
MTSFLRKKNKQDSPTKSANAASVTSSTSPPPLFARFATTAQKDGGTARMVSGPMMLSSQRKDLPQRGLSGNGFGYSSTSLAAGSRDGDAAYIRKMPESHQPPPPASRANPSSPKSPRPDSRLFVDKPLPPPAPDAPITSTVPAVGRRATAAQSPGPPPVFQNQPIRGRASLDNYVPDTARNQPLQRAGSAQAQYAPYKFAPTPPPKTNGSISKPSMGNGPSSQGPPPAFARQHLPTSGNLTSQTLSPRFNHATLDGVNGIGGELPAKRMSLVADVQRTPMSDRAIDLPPEAALFQISSCRENLVSG